MAQSKFSLKLMVHKEEKRVIFAEADSNFVDTLFSIMTLPMATIIRVLRKRPIDRLNPLGSLNNFHQSLLNLSTNCFSTQENQWLLLNPKTSSYDICRKLKLNLDDGGRTRYFICQDVDCSRRSGARFSICNLAKCMYCGQAMDREIKYEDSSVDLGRDGDGDGGGVFVSDSTTFTVTDDLRVLPSSPGLTFQLLSEHGVTSVSCLQEMVFDIGLDQMLDLIKGALLFRNPLTCIVFPDSPFIRSLYDHRPETTLVKHLTKNNTAETSQGDFTLKVTMQKSASKFLFAEADSDFVEFLFGFLKIPLAIMIGELLTQSSSFETLRNLLSSISNMAVGECIKSDEHKCMLLRPQLMHTETSVNQIFSLRVFQDFKRYCRSYFKKGGFCASMTSSVCREGLEKEMFCICHLKNSTVDGRYLKPCAKFILTEDLVITPLTSFSTIAMLGNLKVPLNDVEVHTVKIRYEEALEILDASTKNVSALGDYILKGIIETTN